MREAFAIFDTDGDGRVSLAQVVEAIVRIYKVGRGEVVAGWFGWLMQLAVGWCGRWLAQIVAGHRAHLQGRWVDGRLAGAGGDWGERGRGQALQLGCRFREMPRSTRPWDPHQALGFSSRCRRPTPDARRPPPAPPDLQERKKLALTLADTKSVVAKLELICGVVLHIVFGFIYLMIFEVGAGGGGTGLGVLRVVGFGFIYLPGAGGFGGLEGGFRVQRVGGFGFIYLRHDLRGPSVR